MRTEILYEDKDILVCYKPAGIATQAGGFAQMDVVSELKNYLARASKGEPFVGLVQRLDQPVEGVLVFGKHQKATANLSKQLTDKTLKKEYLAAVFVEDGKESVIGNDMDQDQVHNPITLTDYLIKNPKTNMSEVATANNKQAKKAELTYTILQQEKIEGGTILYIKIDLHTGRHHQIRVQMSHAGMPLLGDQKYGTETSKKVSAVLSVKDVALCARGVNFVHPTNGKLQSYFVKPKKPILQKVTE